MLSDRQTVEGAVRRLECIEFRYDGFRRVAEPYIIGTDKEGATTMFAWQTLSGKGGVPGWRHFRLDGLGELHPTGRHFVPKQPRPDPAKCGFVQVFVKA
jgi:hypothetical protein